MNADRIASPSSALQLIHTIEQLGAALRNREFPNPTVFTELTALADAALELAEDRARARALIAAIERGLARGVFAASLTYLHRLAEMLE